MSKTTCLESLMFWTQSGSRVIAHLLVPAVVPKTGVKTCLELLFSNPDDYTFKRFWLVWFLRRCGEAGGRVGDGANGVDSYLGGVTDLLGPGGPAGATPHNYCNYLWGWGEKEKKKGCVCTCDRHALINRRDLQSLPAVRLTISAAFKI